MHFPLSKNALHVCVGGGGFIVITILILLKSHNYTPFLYTSIPDFDWSVPLQLCKPHASIIVFMIVSIVMANPEIRWMLHANSVKKQVLTSLEGVSRFSTLRERHEKGTNGLKT